MKLLWVFRALFLIIIVAVIFVNINSNSMTLDENNKDSKEVLDNNLLYVTWSSIGIVIFVFLIDIMTPKNKLGALAGVFFGLLVGILISWGLTNVVDMMVEAYHVPITLPAVTAIKWTLGIAICYLAISFVMQTKDDVRFVIPYVEFAKQTKGTRPLILDTSAIIDGRIVDLCHSKLFDAPLIVPRFVLNELQLIADSSQKLKRNRGRRGLDVLNKMQSDPVIDIQIDDSIIPEVEEVKGVDQKLMMLAKANNGRVATTDYNLSKVAQVRDVDVVNINDLASSLKVVALPGETMEVKIIKPGEESEQGIAYLDDGTMIVVEDARNKIGKDLIISVTSSLQTSAGKMIFGKFEEYVQRKYDINHRRPYNKKPFNTDSNGNNNSQTINS
ncbi:MAG: TRAM domain-containing protein [Sedimentisphaerales bacterium]|nr:TRAM domain-containing protein [Sedimentisphaerales bacterium]